MFEDLKSALSSIFDRPKISFENNNIVIKSSVFTRSIPLQHVLGAGLVNSTYTGQNRAADIAKVKQAVPPALQAFTKYIAESQMLVIGYKNRNQLKTKLATVFVTIEGEEREKLFAELRNVLGTKFIETPETYFQIADRLGYKQNKIFNCTTCLCASIALGVFIFIYWYGQMLNAEGLI